MERLVTTSQAAQILGLSVQGVHYRIRKNQLKSIKKSGKTYVYITDQMEKEATQRAEQSKVEAVASGSTKKRQTSNDEHIQSIIEVKDEQIVLLKDSMKWMKKQYKSEINRLEKNQKRIIKVFNSEIKLLQSAFNEMRGIYKNQPKLNQNKNEDSSSSMELITLKEFSVIMKKYNKSEKEIKLIIFNAIKNGDERFIYNRKDKTILIVKSDFEDLV